MSIKDLLHRGLDHGPDIEGVSHSIRALAIACVASVANAPLLKRRIPVAVTIVNSLTHKI